MNRQVCRIAQYAAPSPCATDLLHSDPDIPATDLMLRCGFSTLRHFYRVFKEYTGYSPGQLPEDFSLNMRVIGEDAATFNPTLPSTIEVK